MIYVMNNGDYITNTLFTLIPTIKSVVNENIE